MKMSMLAGIVLASVGPLAGAGADAPVRAHYEITLQKGRSTWTVASAANVSSGTALGHDIGPYRLSLVPRLERHGHYTLNVAVGLIPQGAGAVYAPESRSFAGQMEFPLEFTTTLAGTTVKGAIMVARVRRPPASTARP